MLNFLASSESSRRPYGWKSWISHLSSQVTSSTAYFAETQCASDLQDFSHYISGAEGASCDGGILVPPQTDCSSPHSDQNVFHKQHHVPQHRDQFRTQRLMMLQEKYGSRKVLIPVDVKCTYPRMRQIADGGLYFHGIQVQSSQRNCAAFIVYSPLAPSLVAVVPKDYLNLTNDASYVSLDHPLSSDQLSAFPTEWCPFVMPRNQLSKCLEALRDWMIKVVPEWSNPFSGVVYRGLKRPELQTVDYLFPTDANLQQDLKITRPIWDLLQKHSRGRLNLIIPSVKPSVGDYILEDRSTDEVNYYSVELKRTHSQVKEQAIVLQAVHKGRPYLSPYSQWDLLHVIANSGDHYFFGRDELPTQFCQPPLDYKSRSEFLWQLPLGLLGQRLAGLPTDEKQYYRRLSNILHTQRAANILPATLPIPFTVDWCDYVLTGPPQKLAGSSEPTEPLPETIVARTERGKSHTSLQKSTMLWESDWEVLFRHQSQRAGHGQLFRLGTHSAGRFAFVDMPFNERAQFSELAPETPLLFINLAEVTTIGVRIPHDNKRAGDYLHATHGSHRSFYIIVCRGPNSQEFPQMVCIVPSETIDTSERRQCGLSALQPGKVQRNSTPLVLSQGEPLEAYSISVMNVIEGLSFVLRQGARYPSLSMRFNQGIEIKLVDYVANKRKSDEKQLDFFVHSRLFNGGVRQSKR